MQEAFYSNTLFSFPSNDKLIQIVLEHYESVKHVYFSKMQTLTGTVFSIDHTFKVSKHVGILRRGQVRVKQFENCLFLMSEYGEILAWQFWHGI